MIFKRKNRSKDNLTLTISDCLDENLKTRISFILVVETELDFKVKNTDTVHIKPIFKEKLPDDGPEQFYRSNEYNVVWKLKHSHRLTFSAGSRLYFRVTATGLYDLEDATSCIIWIPFNGQAKLWAPKSITVRKLTHKLDQIPSIGTLNSISYPIIKFNFRGRISLLAEDNYELVSKNTVLYTDQCKTYIPSLDPARIDNETFKEKLFRKALNANLWLSTILYPKFSNFGRSNRLLTGMTTSSLAILVITVFLNSALDSRKFHFGPLVFSVNSSINNAALCSSS